MYITQSIFWYKMKNTKYHNIGIAPTFNRKKYKHVQNRCITHIYTTVHFPGLVQTFQ